jgi:protein phosphatase
MIAIPLPSPALVVLMGAGGAGKSTIAQALAGQEPGVAVISYDACRAEISGDESDQSVTEQAVALARQRIRERCLQQRTTIVDATHIRAEQREFLARLAAWHRMASVLIVVDTPLAVCQARQAYRPRHVPLDVIAGQHADLLDELSTVDAEAFTHVHIARPLGPFPPDEPSSAMVPPF